jgi:hypothetical protein
MRHCFGAAVPVPPTACQYDNFASRHRPLWSHCQHLAPQGRSIAHVAHHASGAVPRTLLPGGTSRFSLRPFDSTSLLDRHDVVGSSFAKTLEIELLDELGQWQFPRLLLVVVDLAQFRRVQPKLSGHLYLAVRQMTASSRLHPFFHLLMCLIFFAIRYRIPRVKSAHEAVERGKLLSSFCQVRRCLQESKWGESNRVGPANTIIMDLRFRLR